jgi:hypothetical protein
MSGLYDPTCIPDPADAIEPKADWRGEIPVGGTPAPSVQPGDVVQSLESRRTYQVLRVKENGRLVLWSHGWPRIKNADPRKWRVLPRIALEQTHAA